ncbi:MAG TPA: bifunctional [glutamate--ammonia ligase]-adenylyl-L-tyrosine phosphorylase/[glutamate--ammonia-ligase] adenylyltransferase [Myxococcaceae bacterium]|nr:bifunctional [glutamate--ammonia ligase]-adenylyl-L-tyrosine phosphorylase/[glutamate--ammonia-ligase] adenylyltransferase [Myxococcaceae bacterium]
MGPSSAASRLGEVLGEARARETLAAARATSDPERVEAALERLLPALATAPDAGPLAVALVEASESLARLLARRPPLLRWLAGSRLERPWSRPRTLAAARGAVARVPPGDRDALHRRLRRFRQRSQLRLAARELCAGAALPEVGREQADVAEALLRAALPPLEAGLRLRHGTPQPEGFAVLGLGKLGGEDLNFSSDVDLVYVYRAEGETSGGPAGAVPNLTYYARLAEALTRALSLVTEDGFCFRVDLGLRPQGRAGPVVLSLAAALQYYERAGRTWERAAWVKARGVAGDDALAGELLAGLGPFLWRRTLDLAAVDALRTLKAEIDLRGQASAGDVKLGPGGIREVEFFAVALQLLHGGRAPALREGPTLRALRRLADAGLLTERDADALGEAYVFLRRVENRLQMVDDRQTQELPRAEHDRLRLARTLGLPGTDALDAELGRHRRFVEAAFRTLLGQTARGEVPDEPLLALALDAELPDARRREALGARGFLDPESALRSLERLRRVLIREGLQEGPGPGVPAARQLGECARSPDPDQALFFLAEFLGNLVAPLGYLRLLVHRPAVARRLINLFGQSAFLSGYFVRNPELLDVLVQGDAGDPHKPVGRIASELGGRLARSRPDEERLSAMRRFKNEEVLRIGLGDISGDLDVPEVAAQLSALADALLDACLFHAEAEARERYGAPRLREGGQAALAVVGLGKLGGVELGYHSDLDLLFVYRGGGVDEETSGGSRGRVSHPEYFARLVQRLLSLLSLGLREGRLYQVDARLRPSGNQGTLVVSEKAFVEHHARHAQLWERQALIKARAVAGDLRFGAALVRSVVHPLVYERPLPSGAAKEIHRLRIRIEREVAGETALELDPKAGHGGLVDVEFATQYLQLLHGGRLPELRLTNTLEALEALRTAGVLGPEDTATLRSGYLFHRQVENRLRLVHGRALARLPTAGPALALLARRLGEGGPDPGPALLAAYRAHAEAVRGAYVRVLLGAAC